MTVIVYVRADTSDTSVRTRAVRDVPTQLDAILGTERRMDLVVYADTDAGIAARDWSAEHRVRHEHALTWWSLDQPDPLAARDEAVLSKHAPAWLIDSVDGRHDWPPTMLVRRVGGGR